MTYPEPGRVRPIGAGMPASFIVTVGCAILTACGGDPSPGAAAWTGTVDTVAGVPVVRSPATPVLESGQISLERQWATDGPSSDTAPLWERPTSMAAVDGELYVLDAQAHHVHRLEAATGEWVGYFGREGGGPGELRAPALVMPWRGAPAVLHAGRRRLERFQPDGTALDAIDLNALVFTLSPMSDSVAVTVAMGVGSRVSLLKGATLEPVTVADPAASTGARFEDCQQIGAATGRILISSCVVPYIRVLRPDGTATMEVRVDADATPRDPAEIEAFIDRIRPDIQSMDLPAPQVDQMISQMRDSHQVRRAFRSARWDAVRQRFVLWEQEEEDFGSGPASFHLFSDDGHYLARIDLDTAIRDFLFLDGDLITLELDPATDLARVVRYTMSDSTEP